MIRAWIEVHHGKQLDKTWVKVTTYNNAGYASMNHKWEEVGTDEELDNFFRRTMQNAAVDKTTQKDI